MFNFVTIIEPIKFLRTVTNKPPIRTYTNAAGELVLEVEGLDLKTSKQFVEACMELGVRRFLADAQARLVRLALPDIKF
jgi:hypothetical protein